MKLSSLLAREKSDLFGIGSTLSIVTMVTLNNLISLYKQSNQTEVDQTSKTILLIFGLFFLFNLLGNMYRAMNVNTTIYSLILPINLLPEWKYCSFCEQNAPARSFHCFTCNKCILKRHNHCVFLGSCIGLKNMRFYLLFMVHVWLGLIVSLIINLDYYVNFTHEFDFKHIFMFFMPLFAFGLGMISLYELFIIFSNAITLILTFLLLFYMILNFTMALYNQTWHERAKNIKIYDLCWKQNLIETFGYTWVQAFLNPFSAIRLPSDGTSFKTNIRNVNSSVNEQSNSNSLFRRRDFNTNII